MKFILGKKLGMTQVFMDDGSVVPVTRVVAGPCQITQVKDEAVKAVQIGFVKTREKNLSKPQIGHLKDFDKVKFLRDFRVEDKDIANLRTGDVITVKVFQVGDKAVVSGNSKGKGFQGVVKRHGFHGSPGSHGHKDQLRMPGSIGATGPQRVFKGTRMAGRMGGDQVTVKNLEIVEVHPEVNELYIKGAVPGARNGLLVIKAEGVLVIESKENNKNKSQTEEVGSKSIIGDDKAESKVTEQLEKQIQSEVDKPAVKPADKPAEKKVTEEKNEEKDKEGEVEQTTNKANDNKEDSVNK